MINNPCIEYGYHNRVQKDKDDNDINENELNENSKVEELRKAAKKLNIKCVSMMSKKQLCEVLGIKITNEGKYVLKNVKTGEEHKFKNMKEISTKFNISIGLISYRMGKNFNVNGNTYSLEKL